jgi:hypothetical protein
MTLRTSRFVIGVSLGIALATPAAADSLSIDFESYALGSPNSQDGWSATGASGMGCALYDHEIVANTYGIAAFGATTLRMSNAVTSGCFGDQTFSKSLTDEAGESNASNNGYSGGTRQGHFEAEWDFASASPFAEQQGLSVVASPDRGDGARMSWIQMADGPGGLQVNFFDYRDEHPVGSFADTSPPGSPGCGNEDNFFFTPMASGLDRSVPHHVKVAIDFLPGPRNDQVLVWVDGVLAHADTTWEDYFRFCDESNPGLTNIASRTVDSILFRTGGSAAPANDGFGFLIDNLSISSAPIALADTAGTWTLFPAQPVTVSTTTGTAYQTLVRPPINADGTSNYPKKRGVIPVQFELSSAATTTATTTVGPVVFESIGSDTDTDNDFAFLRYVPASPVTFADLDELVADYAFALGNCAGGSLRWQVRIDVGADGVTSNDANVFIYYGDVPNFTDCEGAESQSGDNLIGTSEARYDLTQLAGPFYGTYADALARVGTLPALRASLVLDSGWATDQRVDLTGALANGSTWVPEPVGSTSSTSTGAFAPTCELPPAEIKWSKSDPIPDGMINETAESIQQGDSGQYYRIVDCKYLYNLDVSSLDPNLATRQGTYYVYAKIGGSIVNSPARFDLR